jgi:transposase
MTTKGKPPVKYSDEFKMSVVKRVIDEGKPASQVARETGVYENTVRTWVKSYKAHKDEPFIGKGNLHKEDKERKELEKEVRDLREENAILKKAAAIFAKDQR